MVDRAAVDRGRLVLVATPIGNLGDLSSRAVEVLGAADVIAAEDTRRTRALLTHAGIAARGRLVAVHEHNEAARAIDLVTRVADGAVVAVVTDAGMPGISDPGSRLVTACVEAGLVVEVVPGPSAVLAALVVSGLPADRFTFEGFLPRKGAERRARLSEIAARAETVVLFEAPGRVAATLEDLADACGGVRRVAVARELTKVHEEVVRATLAEAIIHVGAHPPRGEHVIVLAGAPPAAAATDEEVVAAVRAELTSGASTRATADRVADLLGVSRRRAYAAVLAERPGRRSK
ncbi:MAG TPA: 16S rRNA (cytidine(1402)-2'-O)-methyltransferase [Acidimicrobiia bacterium]|nr:16S rRNA (cytidine(1402)-2'-O)-methyltransferase [Acidimicrobiia bacterium]